jgi:hypothetical protein
MWSIAATIAILRINKTRRWVTMTDTQRLRYRVNIGTTSKGIPSFDVTCEIHDSTVTVEEREKAKSIALADAEDMVLTLTAKWGRAQDDGTSIYSAVLGGTAL